jgi:hypothetical protein
VKREYPRVDHANRNFRPPRSLLAPPPKPHPARLTHFSCRSCFLGRPWVGRVVLHSLSTSCNSRESLSPSIPPESFVDASTLSRLRSPFHRRSYAVTFVNHFLHLSYSEGAPALQGQQPACHPFFRFYFEIVIDRTTNLHSDSTTHTSRQRQAERAALTSPDTRKSYPKIAVFGAALPSRNCKNSHWAILWKSISCMGLLRAC